MNVREFGERWARLGDRQRQAVRLRCGGKTNREVAELMFVQENSVRNLLSPAFRTIGIETSGDRAPVVCYYLGAMDVVEKIRAREPALLETDA